MSSTAGVCWGLETPIALRRIPSLFGAVDANRQNGSSGRLPDFLVIGAMKSGTTTLYHDLRLNPATFLPDKEANFLLQEEAATLYADALAGAKPDQICGDVSPDYAKLPEIPGVVPRAQALFPRPPKILYLLREPVSRLLSHHYYMSTQRADVPGRMGPDLAANLEAVPSLLNFSRYAMQVRPWIEAFGLESIKVVQFEAYVADRRSVVQEISQFLGVPFAGEGIQEQAVFNRGEDRPVITPFWRRIQHSSFYRKRVRPLLPLETRDRFRRWIFPKPEAQHEHPDPQLIARIVEALKPDVEKLRLLLGHEKPLWDLDAVLEKAQVAATPTEG